jgi:hypothetical protein
MLINSRPIGTGAIQTWREENDVTSENRTDLTHVAASTPDEIRVMLRNAGIALSDELLQQFVAAWPAYEAMIRRIPRSRSYAEEPAHTYRPARIVRG